MEKEITPSIMIESLTLGVTRAERKGLGCLSCDEAEPTSAAERFAGVFCEVEL